LLRERERERERERRREEEEEEEEEHVSAIFVDCGRLQREREREEASRLEKALAKPLSISFPLYRICRHYYYYYNGFSVCLELCVVVVAGLHMNVSSHSREKINLSHFL
jgi:hypothetical protein